MRQNPITKFLLPCAMLLAVAIPATAQQKPDGCVEWKTYTDIVWVEQDVPENRTITETAYETKEVTKSRPRWISEERERTITEKKPVEQTSEKVVTRTVRKPVTTTKTRIKTRVVESYEDVTEMREETYTVKKPVTETVYEKTQVRVRKPVTRRSVEKQEVTVYRPKQSTQTTMVPGTLLVPGQTSSRPRARWLQRGYYSDPYSGQPVWRRSGLHWVDEPQYGQNAVPVVVPQQQSSVTLVPETIVSEKPVETTTYVDEFETREVPVEVERMVEETRSRKVPHTVRIPKRKVIEEEIPYTETTYVDETITETVPYTETIMKTVTRKEPYTQIRETWQDYTETVRVPKTTTRKVTYVSKYRVPYLVEVQIPIDANGKSVARGQQVKGTHRLHPAWRKMIAKVPGASETIRETSTDSSIGKSTETPAKFDIPDAPKAEAQQSVLVSETASDSDSLPDAPKNLKFKTDQKEAPRKLKPIARASKPPAVVEPRETEASRKLNKNVDERFLNLGLTRVEDSDDSDTPDPVSTIETSQSAADLVTELPEPSRADFDPEPISIELPPEASSPTIESALPAAEDTDDDTIEEDVELSRPRS